jgi:hypothetical protein
MFLNLVAKGMSCEVNPNMHNWKVQDISRLFIRLGRPHAIFAPHIICNHNDPQSSLKNRDGFKGGQYKPLSPQFQKRKIKLDKKKNLAY